MSFFELALWKLVSTGSSYTRQVYLEMDTCVSDRGSVSSVATQTQDAFLVHAWVQLWQEIFSA